MAADSRIAAFLPGVTGDAAITALCQFLDVEEVIVQPPFSSPPPWAGAPIGRESCDCDDCIGDDSP